MTALDMARILRACLASGATVIRFDRAQTEELAEWLERGFWAELLHREEAKRKRNNNEKDGRA